MRQLVFDGAEFEATPGRVTRAERSPAARKEWAALRELTEMAAGFQDWPHWRLWADAVELGIRRQWWSKTDVRLLLRPYSLRGVTVPRLPSRRMGRAEWRGVAL